MIELEIRVRTVDMLGAPEHIVAHHLHIEARKPCSGGIVIGSIDTVWFVKHDDGTVGAYNEGELTLE